jgi:hypothetical protein
MTTNLLRPRRLTLVWVLAFAVFLVVQAPVTRLIPAVVPVASVEATDDGYLVRGLQLGGFTLPEARVWPHWGALLTGRFVADVDIALGRGTVAGPVAYSLLDGTIEATLKASGVRLQAVPVPALMALSRGLQGTLSGELSFRGPVADVGAATAWGTVSVPRAALVLLSGEEAPLGDLTVNLSLTERLAELNLDNARPSAPLMLTAKAAFNGPRPADATLVGNGVLQVPGMFDLPAPFSVQGTLGAPQLQM